MRLRPTRKVSPFRVPIQRSAAKPLGPEHSDWFWNPNRIGAKPAPDSFLTQLREVDPDGFVDIRWNPITERWAAFYRKPSMQNPICNGWVLLMKIQYPDGSFMPLDERVLAALYNASARKWGNGKAYFDAVQREAEREKNRQERNDRQDDIDRAMEVFNHSQIRNIGKGNKFSTYHA